MPWKLKGSNIEYANQNVFMIDLDYLNLLGLKLTEGRFFDAKKDQSREEKVVINQAAKKFWGIIDINKCRLLNQYWSADQGYEIIGVVKDFNYQHLSSRPQPMMMVYFQDVDRDFLIKFNNGADKNGLQFLKKLYEQVNPGEPFKYSVLKDEIALLYQKEKQLAIIYILFTIIALAISSIGLFAISLYDTQKRIKEIGIRKVNGAKVIQIMAILNKDFLKWVAIAFIIACPIAWYAMHKWLENFAYKTELSWWIFALAGLLAFMVAFLTVSWQSWRAARRNPVEALRYE